MKSHEFIIEDAYEKADEIATEYDLSPMQVDMAWDIKEDCQFYLSQNPEAMTFDALYRGIKTSEDFLKKKVHLNSRNPLDSSHAMHTEINKLFQQQFGAPFRNSLFCTSDIYQSENYGEPFIIFPRGNFEFLWSPDCEDVYSFYESGHTGMKAYEFARYLLSENRFYTTNFKGAIESGHEIMIRCNSYYGIRNSTFNVNKRKGMEAIINL